MKSSDGTERMLELVMSLPEQLTAGARAACAAQFGRAGRFDAVAVAGMGGSGIGARIAQGLLLDKAQTPIYACNDYRLPAAVSAKTLFVAVSYSGNTEETLSAYAQARQKGCRMVAITSGGESHGLWSRCFALDAGCAAADRSAAGAVLAPLDKNIFGSAA